MGSVSLALDQDVILQPHAKHANRASRSATVVPHDAPTAIQRPALRPGGNPGDEAGRGFERAFEPSELCRVDSLPIQKGSNSADGADVPITQRHADQLRESYAPVLQLRP